MSGTSPVEGAAERTAAAPSAEPVPPDDISFRRRGPLRRYLHRHPRVTDVLVGLVYLLGTVPDVLAAPRDTADLNAAVMVPAFLAGGVLLVLLRRSRPILVTVLLALGDPLLLVYSGGLFSLGFGVLLGLYSVAVRHRPAVTFTVLVVAAIPTGAALFFLGDTLAEGDPTVLWILVVMVVMMYFIAAGVGITMRRNRLHDEEVRAWAHRNAQLASVTERNRIAREMHDIVAHSLTVMIALSDGAAVVMRRDPARAGEVLAELSGTGRSALADMRRVLGVLREDAGPAPGADQPAAPAPRSPLLPGSLESLVDGFSSAGLPATLTRSGPPLPEDPAFLLTVHRIVQESLTNALRYARGASRVQVRIDRTADTVRVSVTDDGAGPVLHAAPDGDAAARPADGGAGSGGRPGSGQGLHGMRERAAIYGGSVQAGPLPGGGWRTTAVLTVPGAPAHPPAREPAPVQGNMDPASEGGAGSGRQGEEPA